MNYQKYMGGYSYNKRISLRVSFILNKSKLYYNSICIKYWYMKSIVYNLKNNHTKIKYLSVL